MNKSNKKTILYFITQSELGGVQRYVLDLSAKLREDFNIIIALGEQGEKGELVNKLKQEGFSLNSEITNKGSESKIIYTIPHLKRAISPLNDFLALLEIIKLIKKTKPDIIHLNSSKISILGSIAKLFIGLITFNSKLKIKNSKLIYTVHGWVFNEPLAIWKKEFYKHAEKITARWKNKLICVSEFDREIAIKEKIAPEKKLTTIHNGIEQINFLSRQAARQKLFSQIPPVILEGSRNEQYSRDSIAFSSRMTKSICIGSIGNLYPTKGFKYLINAIYLLINNYRISTTAIIIGEGEERQELESLIAQLNLRQNIILAGRIDNAARLLPALDVYACSSVKEGLSYTIIEAMQAGLPIAATKVGGNHELITDGEEGVLVKPQNPEDLAKGIIKIINNPGLAKKISANAQQKALAEFSLETMVDKTIKIYLE